MSTNFTVLRVKRDILRRSSIGGIYTGRSVTTAGSGSNQVYGVDGAFSFYDNVNFNGYYARTQTPGLVGDDASYQGVFTYNGDLYALQLDHLFVGDNFNPEVGFRPARRLPSHVRHGPIQPAAAVASSGASVHLRRQPRLHRERGGPGRDPDRASALQHRTGKQRPVRLRLSGQLRAVGPTVPDCLGRHHPGGRLRVPGRLRVVLDGSAAALLRYLLVPARRVLQRATSTRLRLPTSAGSRSRRSSRSSRASHANWIDLPEGTIHGDTGARAAFTYTLTPRTFFSVVWCNTTTATNSLSTNLRLRWEYQPGSELFVVYNDQRATPSCAARRCCRTAPSSSSSPACFVFRWGFAPSPTRPLCGDPESPTPRPRGAPCARWAIRPKSLTCCGLSASIRQNILAGLHTVRGSS